MTTYKIVRFYQDPDQSNEHVASGLTLEEAQAHCEDPESSSETATGDKAWLRTRFCGPWFEGYTEEAA